MSEFSKIQSLLTKSETAEALQLLQTKVSDSWQQSVLLLRASYAQLEKEVMNGLIDSETAQRRRNQINASALQLLEKVQSGADSPETMFQSLKKHYWNQNIAEEMKNQEQNSTNISGSNINIEGSSDVVIGSGNTVTKKIFKALGRWQFWTIVVVLLGLGTFIFLGGQEVMGQQEENFASLNTIQDQLEVLIAEQGDKLAEKAPALKQNLQTGMEALKQEDYPTAIRELEELAKQAPIAAVYKNLAYAYDKEGNYDKAFDMRQRAENIDPKAYAPVPASAIRGKYVNLLARENGGLLAVTSDQKMERLNDYQLNQRLVGVNSWAVFSFNEERSATIDQLDFFIANTDNYNPREITLLVSNDTPTGPFDTVGVFNPLNAFIKKTPFQEFKFSPVKARYVKFIIGRQQTDYGTVGVRECRLWGKLQ